MSDLPRQCQGGVVSSRSAAAHPVFSATRWGAPEWIAWRMVSRTGIRCWWPTRASRSRRGGRMRFWRSRWPRPTRRRQAGCRCIGDWGARPGLLAARYFLGAVEATRHGKPPPAFSYTTRICKSSINAPIVDRVAFSRTSYAAMPNIIEKFRRNQALLATSERCGVQNHVLDPFAQIGVDDMDFGIGGLNNGGVGILAFVGLL